MEGESENAPTAPKKVKDLGLGSSTIYDERTSSVGPPRKQSTPNSRTPNNKNISSSQNVQSPNQQGPQPIPQRPQQPQQHQQPQYGFVAPQVITNGPGQNYAAMQFSPQQQGIVYVQYPSQQQTQDMNQFYFYDPTSLQQQGIQYFQYLQPQQMQGMNQFPVQQQQPPAYYPAAQP